MPTRVTLAAAFATVSALSGCGGKPAAVPSSGPTPSATPTPTTTPLASATPFTRDKACATSGATAQLVAKPVDIIIVVDNSGSMSAKIKGVEKNINTNFAAIMGASGLDYRVILIADHGSSSQSQSVCIEAPLSGIPIGGCANPPAKPVNGPRFFHYNNTIESNDSLSHIIDYWDVLDHDGNPAWNTFLRADSVKAFIEITDDQPYERFGIGTAAEFETALFAKSTLFGNAMGRNYVFHTIGGFKANTPATNAWLPTDPLVTDAVCQVTGGGGGVAVGEEYQKLSVMTGGLRFPICEYDNFDKVFQAVAAGVVQSSRLGCEFPVPAAPEGQVVNRVDTIVDYTPDTGTLGTLTQVSDAAHCVGAGYYFKDTTIALCPDSCTAVTQQSGAKLSIYFECIAPLL